MKKYVKCVLCLLIFYVNFSCKLTEKEKDNLINIENIDFRLIGTQVFGEEFKKILKEYNKPKDYIYVYGVEENIDSIAKIYVYNREFKINNYPIKLYNININYEDTEVRSLIGIIYDEYGDILGDFIFYQYGYSPEIEKVITVTSIDRDKITLKTQINDQYEKQIHTNVYHYRFVDNKFISN